jgi:hypothetical protein
MITYSIFFIMYNNTNAQNRFIHKSYHSQHYQANYSFKEISILTTII